ncbi:MAG: hypothetical protein GY854_31940 [Deltaproteobacteria bacterium]|nr:hypothetical protein [Deltaproteobacteria bacterium]
MPRIIGCQANEIVLPDSLLHNDDDSRLQPSKKTISCNTVPFWYSIVMPGRIWEQAFDVATDQYGFITFADVSRLGADPARLRRWYLANKIDRIGHGIYRFRQIPSTQLDPYMLATLWPAGRGVLSHVTALELHELCDTNPDKIHMTLPPHYRPRRKGGELYVLHYENLVEDELTWHEGIRIVSPTVAIRQAIHSSVPTHLVRQAIATSRRLGIAPKQSLDSLTIQIRERK